MDFATVEAFRLGKAVYPGPHNDNLGDYVPLKQTLLCSRDHIVLSITEKSSTDPCRCTRIFSGRKLADGFGISIDIDFLRADMRMCLRGNLSSDAFRFFAPMLQYFNDPHASITLIIRQFG
jgi:hypothetical protein